MPYITTNQRTVDFLLSRANKNYQNTKHATNMHKLDTLMSLREALSILDYKPNKFFSAIKLFAQVQRAALLAISAEHGELAKQILENYIRKSPPANFKKEAEKILFIAQLGNK